MNNEKFKEIIKKEEEVISKLNDTTKLREKIRSKKEKHNKEVEEIEPASNKKIANHIPEANL